MGGSTVGGYATAFARPLAILELLQGERADAAAFSQPLYKNLGFLEFWRNEDLRVQISSTRVNNSPV